MNWILNCFISSPLSITGSSLRSGLTALGWGRKVHDIFIEKKVMLIITVSNSGLNGNDCALGNGFLLIMCVVMMPTSHGG